MNFDDQINRFGTHSVKWDMMERLYGVPADKGLSMWVADMDFRPPHCVQAAVEKMVAHGIYGYYGDDAGLREAIRWWMDTRHGWALDPDHIFITHGLVNATGMVVDTYTVPGDAVVLMTPVYHAFARTIKAAGRVVVECPLALVDGRYQMDFDAWDAQMTGQERLLILCSPHNPGGRVWTAEELRGVADFCKRHDLILVSDEIHHDLVMPGHKHIAMPVVAPDCADRLVMLTASTKTFNIAGAHIGNVIIADDKLRAQFATKLTERGLSGNAFGMHLAEAAYSPEGAVWVDALVDYLDGNRRLFDAGMNTIPGLRSMPLEATYLSWVDFTDTGMAPADFKARVEKFAQICANHGETFGAGGESYLRVNLAMPRARIEEAVERLQSAFGDLQ